MNYATMERVQKMLHGSYDDFVKGYKEYNIAFDPETLIIYVMKSFVSECINLYKTRRMSFEDIDNNIIFDLHVQKLTYLCMELIPEYPEYEHAIMVNIKDILVGINQNVLTAFDESIFDIRYYIFNMENFKLGVSFYLYLLETPTPDIVVHFTDDFLIESLNFL